MDSVSHLASLLQATLDPARSTQVERQIKALESQPGFTELLIRLIPDEKIDTNTRLSAALFLKNFLKRNWADAEGNHLLSDHDSEYLKSTIIDLAMKSSPRIQSQLTEAINVIADVDFPDNWPALLDSLISYFDRSNYPLLIGALKTAHAIFKRWRPLFRSDNLFKEILFVLDKFSAPYLEIFTHVTDQIAASPSNDPQLPHLLESFSLLCKLFIDLNCQDIPEFFEDNMSVFMPRLCAMLTYQNPLIEANADDDEPTILEKIRASICEIAQLYTKRYQDVFESLPTFMSSAWQLLSMVRIVPRFEYLITKAMGFLTAVFRSPSNLNIATIKDKLGNLLEQIVIPCIHIQERELEQFEDQPFEYIQYDLEGSDNETRRRAAADLISALLALFEEDISKFFTHYITSLLQQQNFTNQSEKTVAKDTAYFLISAVAIKSKSVKGGVSSTSPFFNISEFYNYYVLPDIKNQNERDLIHADAIKYVSTFCSQLSSDEVFSALPDIIKYIDSTSTVVSTYSAVALEKVLSLHKARFTTLQSTDGEPLAKCISQAILKKLSNTSDPTKLAENEFLMKCLLRSIVTMGSNCQISSSLLSSQLATILLELSKNPWNSKFNHLTFESIGALIRFSSPAEIKIIEESFYPLFQQILNAQVAEFTPYVLQVVAKICTDQQGPGLHSFIKQLFPMILAPSIWEDRQNTAMSTRFVQAVITKDALFVINNNYLESVLGVFQKLISSKATEGFAFDILETIYNTFPPEHLNPYSNQIFTLLLTRLHNSKTERLVLRFVVLQHLICASETRMYGPEYIINTLENIRNGLFLQIQQIFVIPNTQKLQNYIERKFSVVGLTNMILLLCTPKFQIFGAEIVSQMISLIIRLLECSPNISKDNALEEDFDSESFNYMVHSSTLSSIKVSRLDPCPTILDSKSYFVNSSNNANSESLVLSKVISLLSPAERQILTSFGIRSEA